MSKSSSDFWEWVSLAPSIGEKNRKQRRAEKDYLSPKGKTYKAPETTLTKKEMRKAGLWSLRGRI